MKTWPKISIIIPLYVIVPRFFKDLLKFKSLKYPNYEILVVSDSKVKINDPKIRLILTGRSNTGPAEKRDIALQRVKGEICAFIDDDAYPNPNWLSEIATSLHDPLVVGVGGPGVTPVEDSYWSQLGGAVYESILTSGKAQDRFISKQSRTHIDDWPAYNLAVRTQELRKVGGYGNSFYGGEDTFLCLKLIKNGKQLVYNPRMIVYHHRRPLFVSHLKQIFNVGVHRGYFAKIFPETSRRLFYFLPTILTFGLFGLLTLVLFNPKYFSSFLTLFGIFIGIAYLSVINRVGLIGGILAAIAIIFTHITYGLGFVNGLLERDLQR